MDRKQLEERLIDFAVLIIKLADKLPKTYAGIAIAKQIVRSGTSPALNYGEAQSAESKKDFIHKLQIVLKELRETNVSLRIIEKAKMLDDKELLHKAKTENEELIRIFVTTVNSLKKNN